MKPITFELLLNFLVSEMEKKGLVITNYTFALDNEFVRACNEFCGTSSKIDKYREILQQCITHEYIRNKTVSPLTCLAITQKGVGIVSSNRRSKEIDDSKTCLKKLSDIVLEHHGLFIAIGVILALITLFIKLWWNK
ncbi:hypothetical protein [Legionella maioricensis]|uniref:Uncharacterized protein n=1 Tax=Legionella maioricensis TaxID=2896528 RepID=A0A9X2CYC8_9GAMM|nr:hypothetical protein [Legionella maioricensis]MCL9682740.1 hypothetical protein [Legionella maioricensis]MCL9687212.1 hypothetical protein [Legionella maioricensis]